MTIKKLMASLLGLKQQGLQVGASTDFNSNVPVTSGPRAYIYTAPGVFVPLTMAGLAMSIDDTMADSILREIDTRLAAIERDRAEFVEARHLHELSTFLHTHHPEAAADFARVATVKRALKRKTP